MYKKISSLHALFSQLKHFLRRYKIHLANFAERYSNYCGRFFKQSSFTVAYKVHIIPFINEENCNANVGTYVEEN